MGTLLEATKAADEQINAIHAAFGAPGDYGYESREGKALFALYKFQAELRGAIADASKMPMGEVENARVFGDDIEHYRIRVGALARERDELRAEVAKLDRVVEALDMAESEEEPAERIKEMVEYIEILRQQGDFTRLPVVAEFLRQCFTRVNAPHWFGSSERKDLIEGVAKILAGGASP